MKKDSQLMLLIIGRGKIFGEYECLEDLNHQFTVTCMSQKALTYQIDKRDLQKLRIS